MMQKYIFLFVLLIQISAKAQAAADQDFIVAQQISKDEISLAHVGVRGDSFKILDARTARLIDGDWNDFERGGRVQFKLSDSEYVEIRNKKLASQNIDSHKTTTDIFTAALKYKTPRNFSAHFDKNDPIPVQYCYRLVDTTSCLTSQLVRRLNLDYQNHF